MSKWISIKDRLPKLNVDVVTCRKDGYIGVDWRDEDDGEFVYGSLYGGVTHWMPLPEPPKED